MSASYQTRVFRNLSDWSIADHRLKPYAITVAEAPAVQAPLVDAAVEHTRRVLPPAAAAEGGSERLGYGILHTGTLGTWLLIHWWAHGDICCGRLALAAPGNIEFRSMDDRPLLACVWEQVVMHHERGAWVRHMMAPRPDADAYFGDRLADGRY